MATNTSNDRSVSPTTIPSTTTEGTIVSLPGSSEERNVRPLCKSTLLDWPTSYLMDPPDPSPTTEKSIPPSPLTDSVRRHKTYYFENDQVIFQVEDTLFNVHRSLLMRHSIVFRDMFDMPPTPGESAEGSSDQNPIRLENVKAIDFERLLSILYPSVIGKYSASLSEWISILQLATRWLFDDVRALAIGELTDLKIDPVQKIVIALQCDIPEWLHSAYMALCIRKNPLTLEEGRKLGVDVVTKLAYAREICRDNNNTHRNYRDGDVSMVVTDIFGTFPSKKDDKPPELVLKWNGFTWNNALNVP